MHTVRSQPTSTHTHTNRQTLCDEPDFACQMQEAYSRGKELNSKYQLHEWSVTQLLGI